MNARGPRPALLTLLTLGLGLAACPGPTGVEVSVIWEALDLDQLSAGVYDDEGEAVVQGLRLPAEPAPLRSGESFRILLDDELGGTEVRVSVQGRADGATVATGGTTVGLLAGSLSAATVALQPGDGDGDGDGDGGVSDGGSLDADAGGPDPGPLSVAVSEILLYPKAPTVIDPLCVDAEGAGVDTGEVTLRNSPAFVAASLDGNALTVSSQKGAVRADDLVVSCRGDEGPDVTLSVVPVAPSCSHLLASGVFESGLYRLDTDGLEAAAEPYDAWCEMSAAVAGGGWTLALKVPGDDEDWRYDGARWSGSDTFGGNDLAQAPEGARLPTFFQAPATEVLVRMAPPGVALFGDHVVELVEPATLQMVTVGAAQTRPAGPEPWEGLIGDAFLIGGPCAEGGNQSFEGCGARLGILGACTCGDATIGVGLAGDLDFTACPVSAGGVHCGLEEEPRYAYVFVRSDDLTAFDPEPSCQHHLDEGRLLSGRYRIQPFGNAELAPVEVFCEMDPPAGEAWARIGHLRAFDPCPGTLVDDDFRPSGVPWICWHYGDGASATFPVAYEWQHFRLDVRGYLFGDDHAGFVQGAQAQGEYLDGLSFTHGQSSHVASVVIDQPGACPCAMSYDPPPFVGTGYVCYDGPGAETSWSGPFEDAFLTPLSPDDAECSTVSPFGPTLERDLASPTTEDVDMRAISVGADAALGLTELDVWVR